MQNYFLNDEFDELMLTIDGGTASVDCWSDRTECYEAIDVTPWFIQGLINRVGLPLVVGARLGWREMGSEYSNEGYFSVMELVE